MVRCTLCLLALPLSLAHASAQTLPAALDVLEAFPATISLSGARGIAIVPGANRGRGVLLVKRDDGWPNPAFVTLSGHVNHGTSSERTDLVLVFRTRRSADRVVNGDGKIAPEVTAYARTRGPFAEVNLAGAVLARRNLVPFHADRNHLTELKTKITALTAPKRAPVPEAEATPPLDWALVVENRNAIFGALTFVSAWLASRGKRKR